MKDGGSVTGATAVWVGLETGGPESCLSSFLIVIVAGRGDSSAMWKPTGRESFFFWTQLLEPLSLLPGTGNYGRGIDRLVAPSQFTVYMQPSLLGKFPHQPVTPDSPQRTSEKTSRGAKVQPEARRFALTSDPHNAALCRTGIRPEFPRSIARPPGFASRRVIRKAQV